MGSLFFASRGFGQTPLSWKPNILFILIDDLGWADLPVYGNSFHETPNLDQFTREGMKFTDAYAAGPTCSPTRGSILTGRYTPRTGITQHIIGHWRPFAKLADPDNRQEYLPPEEVTIAELLKSAGYRTAHFGKWHLGGSEHHPGLQGFDDWIIQHGAHYEYRLDSSRDFGLNTDQYLTNTLTHATIQFMRENKNLPFFVHLSHKSVHVPLDAREDLIDKYRQKEGPPNRPNNPVYAAMIEQLDASIGHLLTALDDLRLRENTLVVFYSDNGGLRMRFDKKPVAPKHSENNVATTNLPLRDEKGSLYEGGIRVPLMVRFPGVVEAGTECHTPVNSIDFLPTFLEIAGTSAPSTVSIDGESLLPLFRQSDSLCREALYWHFPHYHHTSPAGAIRAGDWKLIEYFNGDPVELYNLNGDLGEQNNLAKEHPEQVTRLLRMLTAWRDSVGAKMPEENFYYDPSREHEWAPRHQKPFFHS